MPIIVDCLEPEHFRQARERLDLADLVREKCGPSKHGKYACPWHTSDDPGGSRTLTIDPEGRSWRCWSCEAGGSALDWLALREGLTPQDVVRRVLGMKGEQSSRSSRRSARGHAMGPAKEPPAAVPATPRPMPWRSSFWQRAVDDLVHDAEQTLWSPAGEAVRGWLRARGLLDMTIRRFRLGFIPRPHRRPVEGEEGVWVERGVLIPWVSPEGWYDPLPDPDGDPEFRWCGANVRRLPEGDLSGPTPDPKYKAISGSSRGFLYPFPEMTPGVPALICEGELDSLIAWQQAGWVVNPATVGGAGQSPQPEALDALADAGHWLILPDADTAGEKALARWEALDADRVVPVLLPGSGKDLTDFVRAGGDVLGWLAAEFASMGWELPRTLRDHPG